MKPMQKIGTQTYNEEPFFNVEIKYFPFLRKSFSKKRSKNVGKLKKKKINHKQ